MIQYSEKNNYETDSRLLICNSSKYNNYAFYLLMKRTIILEHNTQLKVSFKSEGQIVFLRKPSNDPC